MSLHTCCESLISAEPDITRYDTIAGDGDCGLTLKSGAEGVLELLKRSGGDEEDRLDENDAVASILAIADVIERKMDGTSGALYS